jgi:uncharacterized Zn-finger protein
MLVVVSCCYSSDFTDGYVMQLGLVTLEDGRTRCLACTKTFTQNGNARRHYKESHQSDASKLSYFCQVCQAGFHLKRYCDAHMLTKHGISRRMLKSQVIP